MNLMKIIDLIEEKFPLSLQEDWDCSGLQIDRNKDVNKIVVCLDITSNIVNYAIENKVDMIISHHPLIFRNYYESFNYIRGLYQKLYASNITIYSMHTNYDNHPEGMNYQFVKELGYDILSINNSLLTFKCDHNLIDNLKKITNETIKIYNENKEYHNVSVILGSGGSFIEHLSLNNSNVLISSEFKHHEILYAYEHGITLIDINHQAEVIFVSKIAEYLKSILINTEVIELKEKYAINFY